MAEIVDLTIDDDDYAHSTSSESGSKSGYTTPSANKFSSSGTLSHLFSTYHSKRYILLYNKVVIDLTKSTDSSSSLSLPSNQNFKQG